VSRPVLAIDPGRDKCGVAVLSPAGALLFRQVVPTAQLENVVSTLVEKHAPTIIMGNGTTSAAAKERVEALGGAVTLVDEYRTTDAAKSAYWEAYPPHGWRRLVPRGLLVPPVPVDDFAAVILAQRFLQMAL